MCCTWRSTRDPVQVTVLAADSIDAANKLGEVVEQMRASAHKLHQAKLLPVEADNAVQRAAIAFADAKDAAVTGHGSSAADRRCR
jgi:formylmethanofuran dehydrogenase subunit B